jgi:hypothetical protein
VNYVTGVNYVIGHVSLATLLEKRERINASGSFLATTGEIILKNASLQTKVQLTESVGVN